MDSIKRFKRVLTRLATDLGVEPHIPMEANGIAERDIEIGDTEAARSAEHKALPVMNAAKEMMRHTSGGWRSAQTIPDKASTAHHRFSSR